MNARKSKSRRSPAPKKTPSPESSKPAPTSRSTPQRRSRTANRTASLPVVDPVPILVSFGVGLLLTARWLTPTEGAAAGETLWIVQAWLGLGVLWAWGLMRTRRGPFAWSAFDVAAGLIVLGHVVSAAALVAMADGNARTAVNMLWEWLALGTTLVILRQFVRTDEQRRQKLLWATSTVAALSVLGVLQPYVLYPQTRTEYRALREELDMLAGDPSPRAMQRAQAIRSTFAAAGITGEDASLASFENRLDSTEPVAMFSLANTFAGLLAAGLILALGLATQRIADGGTRGANAASLLIAAAILFCLILTKSRTAWIGAAAGAATWFALNWLSSRRTRETGAEAGRSVRRQRIARVAVAGLLVAGAMIAVAAGTGRLDRLVVIEAPKSMRYRGEYWQGAWRVLKERPLLGSGPGNFRQHYLKYKQPESSEEVADPHNFVFDLWASGGLIALGGLAWAAFLGVRGLFRIARDNRPRLNNRLNVEDAADIHDPEDAADIRSDAGSVGHVEAPSDEAGAFVWGAGCAFPLVAAWVWFSGFEFDWRLVGLLPVWLIALYALTRRSAAIPTTACAAGAVVAVLVHLLGAGGIEMPAVVQLLIVLIVAAGPAAVLDDASHVASIVRPRGVRRVAGFVALVTFGGLFVACLTTATLPVFTRSILVRAGDQATPTQSRIDFTRAAEADRLSPTPRTRLARLYYLDSVTTDDASAGFNRAVDLQREAIRLDPHSAMEYRSLGGLYLSRFRTTEDPAQARQAADAFAFAVKRYPAHSAIRAEYAAALEAAGDLAAAGAEAQEALRLDGVNRELAHYDRTLPRETVAEMKRLAEES